MRAYADTSFLVKLLAPEPGTTRAISEYRRLGRPPLLFLSLHRLEVANAVRQRAFHQRRTAPAAERPAIKRQRDASLALLQKYLARGAFIEASHDLDAALELACALSAKHTERLGCRGFDLLHVALALDLHCEVFLTSDRVQGALARVEGLDVMLSADE